MPTFEWYSKFLLKYMAFKVIIIVIELIFLGINMFLALLRAHFNPRYVQAKMILSPVKNIFMPAKVNSIVTLTNPGSRKSFTTLFKWERLEFVLNTEGFYAQHY